MKRKKERWDFVEKGRRERCEQREKRKEGKWTEKGGRKEKKKGNSEVSLIWLFSRDWDKAKYTNLTNIRPNLHKDFSEALIE